MEMEPTTESKRIETKNSHHRKETQNKDELH